MPEYAVGIILVVIPFVLGGVSYWLVSNRPKQQGRFEYALYELAEMAVQAAEQLYNTKQVQDRKAYAVGVLQAALKEKFGRVPSLEVLEAAIEAAVFRGKPEPPITKSEEAELRQP